MKYYFYEFSDLNREPIVFENDEKFEMFCKEYKIYAWLEKGGFLKEKVCTCIPGTNVCVMNDVVNWRTKKETLELHLRYGLDNDLIDFCKDITKDKDFKTYCIDNGIFLVIANNQPYKLWVNTDKDWNIDYYPNTQKYIGNKFLLKIQSIYKLKPYSTQINDIFNELML